MKIVKSIFLIICILFVSHKAMAAPGLGKEEEKNLRAGFNEVLTDLETLIKKYPEKHKYSEDLFYFTMQKSKNKELSFYIIPVTENSKWSGIRFEYKNDTSDYAPGIALSPYLIELYKKYPSFVFSALVHEMQHAKSFFDNTEYFVSVSEIELEVYLYELDAYNVEANFIIAYLKDNPDYSLTRFEEFLSQSYQKDYLSSFSYQLLGYDMDYTFRLMKIVNQKISYEEKIKQIIDSINSLNSTKFDSSEEKTKQYAKTVPLRTAIIFIPRLLLVDSTHNKITAEDDYSIQKCQPETYRLPLQTSDLFSNHIDEFSYLNELIDYYLPKES